MPAKKSWKRTTPSTTSQKRAHHDTKCSEQRHALRCGHTVRTSPVTITSDGLAIMDRCARNCVKPVIGRDRNKFFEHTCPVCEAERLAKKVTSSKRVRSCPKPPFVHLLKCGHLVEYKVGQGKACSDMCLQPNEKGRNGTGFTGAPLKGVDACRICEVEGKGKSPTENRADENPKKKKKRRRRRLTKGHTCSEGKHFLKCHHTLIDPRVCHSDFCRRPLPISRDDQDNTDEWKDFRCAFCMYTSGRSAELTKYTETKLRAAEELTERLLNRAAQEGQHALVEPNYPHTLREMLAHNLSRIHGGLTIIRYDFLTQNSYRRFMREQLPYQVEAHRKARKEERARRRRIRRAAIRADAFAPAIGVVRQSVQDQVAAAGFSRFFPLLVDGVPVEELRERGVPESRLYYITPDDDWGWWERAFRDETTLTEAEEDDIRMAAILNGDIPADPGL